MTDKLKQYIDDHRDEFDSEVPRPVILSNLKKKWNPSSSRSWQWHSLKWAAVVVGLLLISATIYLVLKKEKKAGPEITKQVPVIEATTGIEDPIYAKQIENF